MTIEKTATALKSLFCVAIAAGAAMVVVFESNLVLPGGMAGDSLMEYCFTVGLELLPIASLPLALRLFKFAGVKARLAGKGAGALLPLAVVRMMLIAVPMLANALLYYLFMSTTFGYMAIICLLCMTFIYPSAGRCQSEITFDEE